jgi:hypothetical protein
LAERDRLCNSAAAGLPVRRLTLPVVAITFPADLSLIAATTVTGTGTVSDPTDGGGQRCRRRALGR